ncbi:hypothetical protein E3A20_13850 [Planctomyces bekefii]|uniref:Cytochrome c domain-containing protein n=1 Tax=Planctomyces bekefii TaxID=1653850 RepID=A0A5C6M5U0_9PLAN|nr:hypothetical protein E3A20_13850 [Planctomyces bekefii]
MSGCVDYQTHVFPIINAACRGCHGDGAQFGGFTIPDTPNSLATVDVTEIDRRNAIMRRIDDSTMPPTFAATQISQTDRNVINAWRDGGYAIIPDHCGSVTSPQPVSNIPKSFQQLLSNKQLENSTYHAFLGNTYVISAMKSSFGMLGSDRVSDGYDTLSQTMTLTRAETLLNTGDIIGGLFFTIPSGQITSLIGTCWSTQPASSTCITNFVTAFLSRAFRRPPTTAELNRYVAFVNGASTQTEGIKRFISAVFSSPKFLYLIEAEGTRDSQDDSIVNRSAHEVAARMSMMIWGEPPDTTLRSYADNGTLLSDPQVLTSETTRLLSNAKAKNYLVRHFFMQWLDLDMITVGPYSDRYYVLGDALSRLVGNINDLALERWGKRSILCLKGLIKVINHSPTFSRVIRRITLALIFRVPYPDILAGARA